MIQKIDRVCDIEAVFSDTEVLNIVNKEIARMNAYERRLKIDFMTAVWNGKMPLEEAHRQFEQLVRR